MKRPYVICHMTMSIDGKVTGNFLYRSEAERATEIYYEINREYKADAFACGRVTMEGSFTHKWYPDLSEYEPTVDKDDFIPEKADSFYAVSFDTKGRLGWKSNRIVDDDPGYGNARIIEVLSESADPKHLSYLRKMEIPYVFAGEKEIDVTAALFKLKEYFGIEKLLLEGGSIINGAFEKADVIDELSLVVNPVIADTDSKPLFMQSSISDYELSEVKKYDSSVLWLNYKK